MQNYFYRDKASQEIGPLSLDALAKLRFAGVLDGDTPVRVADSAEWKPCREIIADPSQPLPSQTSAAPVAKSPFSPVLIVLVIIGALVYGGMTLYKSIAVKTTLTYGFFVDGKELSPLQVPEVEVDGQLFASGNHLKPGRHQIAVNLDNVERYKQHFWVIYGNKNLGTLPLESSKGSLSVTVNPSPANVVLQREGEVVRKGDAPLNLDKLRIGDYTLIIRRGEYEETRSANIQREQQTKVQVDLNLGSVDLSSDPTDADFELSGNGRHWQGKLPTKIEDVPGGNYSLVVSRKGWKLNKDISISRGSVTTNKTEFQYGSIDVTSDPTGLAVSTNGVEIGKTPLTLHEVKPGQYTLAVSDGENDLLSNVSVGLKEAAKLTFAFRYGTVQLASTPTGATVIRKGKEIGKTPLTLNRVAVGETMIELRLQGYVTTNFPIWAVESVTVNYSANLINERYLRDLADARDAADASPPDYHRAVESITDALQVSPGDVIAFQLSKDYEFGLDLNEALHSLEKGDLDDALAQIDSALVLKPSDTEAVSLKSKIAMAKTRREQAVFKELIASVPNAKLFSNHTAELKFSYDKVWDAVLKQLTAQHEKIIKTNKEKGVFETDITPHTFLVLGYYDKYVILIEKINDNTTKVAFMLLRYELGTNNQLVPVSSEVVNPKAHAFVNEINKQLQAGL